MKVLDKLCALVSSSLKERRECCMNCALLSRDNALKSCADAYLFVGINKWPYVKCEKYKSSEVVE